MNIRRRLPAIATAIVALAAICAGCGDKHAQQSQTACRTFVYAIASFYPKAADGSMDLCDAINEQNADQTVSDMQDRCVRLASSTNRWLDKNLPSEQTVTTRNQAIARCNAATAVVRGGT